MRFKAQAHAALIYHSSAYPQRTFIFVSKWSGVLINHARRSHKHLLLFCSRVFRTPLQCTDLVEKEEHVVAEFASTVQSSSLGDVEAARYRDRIKHLTAWASASPK